MKNLLLFLNLFLLVSCVEKKNKPDCGRFKDGRFLLKEGISRTRFTIERKNELQTELNENTDTVTTLKLRWLGDCEYELVKMSKMKKTIRDSSKAERVFEFKNENPIRVKITSTADSYYVFAIKNDLLNKTYSDTIWKLR